MYLGNIEKYVCQTSSSAPNGSVCITGISGSGKSTKANRIELEEAKAGHTVIVLDYSRNHQKESILPALQEEYDSYVNRIYAKDGLGMPILTPVVGENGQSESYVGFVGENVRIFSSLLKLGTRQQGVFRQIFIEAAKIKAEYSGISETEAFKLALGKISSPMADEICQKLWTVLESGALCNGKSRIERKKINIIDLSDMGVSAGVLLAQFILDFIWRVSYYGGIEKQYGDVLIVLDEFQHCSIKRGFPIHTILSEGRKFGLKMLLVTQTLGIFSVEERALLSQTATNLYFRPEVQSLAATAKIIDSENPAYWKKKLQSLSKGSCVAFGMLEVNGRKVERPLVLTENIPKKQGMLLDKGWTNKNF